MVINDSLLTYEEKVLFTLRELYANNGYSRFIMSRFEEYDLYAGCKDFLVSDRIITFTDLDGRLVALKPDVTMSIVRQAESGGVQKLYYNENVYRAAAGNKNFKEIMQTGVECIGTLTQKEICETVALAVKSLAAISDNYILTLSHPEFAGGIISAAGIAEESAGEVLEFVRNRNASGLAAYCAEAGISREGTDLVLSLITCHGSAKECLTSLSKYAVNKKAEKAYEEIKAICDYLNANGLADNVQIDFSIANNMDYYDGIVFCGYIDGVPNGLLSGGQYGGLMQKMGKNAAAVGFAVYVDELRYLQK